MRRRITALAAAGLAVVSLAACSQDPNSVGGQAQQGSDKNYISQDGMIEHVAVAQRKAPVDLKGTTLDGTPWKLSDAQGRYVVLNVWGSWCPPCIAEQPELDAAHAQLKGKQVDFMGINIRDSVQNAKAYHDGKKVPYPSLQDDGAAIAALQGTVTSPPVTLVIDRQGRIAGRIGGRTTTATLVGLVEDVIKDGA